MTLSLLKPAPSAFHGGPNAETRARALLGARPTLTLAVEPDSQCTVRCVRLGDTYFGVVPDHAAFTDRVRMGATATFVAGSADQPDVVVLAGAANTRILGRLESVSGATREALATLLGPYDTAHAVVVEVRCEGMELLNDDDAAGAVPRT